MQKTEITVVVTIIAVVSIALILSFRLRRMQRSMPLNVKRLWIAPAVLAAMAAITLAQFPLTWLNWVWLLIAFAIGGGLGWQRGRMMTIVMDPANRTLTRQATPMAIYFLLALVVIRLGLRTGLGMEAKGWGISPAFVNDVFVVFAVGLFMTQALEMGIRARRILAGDSNAAVQAVSDGPSVGGP